MNYYSFNRQFWLSVDKLVNESQIIIDRPKNSAHPKYNHLIYPVNYGYLKDTTSMDGSGIDVWVGSQSKIADGIICVIDLLKRDSEIKILIGCTDTEKEQIFEFHNFSDYVKAILINRQD